MTNLCFGCYKPLIDGPFALTVAADRCLDCGRWYHPGCWKRYAGCTGAECPGKGRTPRTEFPPRPQPEEPPLVAYPYMDGPLNLLADAPLGVSTGVVMDGFQDRVVVRNNTTDPLTVDVPRSPPWVSVRVRRGRGDPCRPGGRAVIPPGETRELSVAFHTFRPSVRRRLELRAVPGDEIGATPAAMVPLVVQASPASPVPLFAAALLYVLLLFWVVYELAAALVHPPRGVWALTFAAAVGLGYAALVAPGWVANAVARAVGWAEAAGPAGGSPVGRWLVAPEHDGDWLARRSLLFALAFVPALVPGYLFWVVVLGVLDLFTGSFVGVAVLVLLLVAAAVVAGWLPLRPYNGLLGIYRAVAGPPRTPPAPVPPPPSFPRP